MISHCFKMLTESIVLFYFSIIFTQLATIRSQVQTFTIGGVLHDEEHVKLFEKAVENTKFNTGRSCKTSFLSYMHDNLSNNKR